MGKQLLGRLVFCSGPSNTNCVIDLGHDEQEKERGTWLGIRKDGRIGNTLSITEPEGVQKQRPLAPTRGIFI
jgi:hypothetical protein